MIILVILAIMVILIIKVIRVMWFIYIIGTDISEEIGLGVLLEELIEEITCGHLKQINESMETILK
jgi:hypothetical protein